MKGKASTLFVIVIFIAGLSLLLYPTVSNFINAWYHSQMISDYSQQVEQLEEYEYREEWDKAVAYNEAILDRVSQTSVDAQTRNLYYSLLNTTGRNIMGYVEIPSISCTLPISHGTAENTLLDSVGHLEWSSLPVGGESTHCVISGHRGLPSSELFTNIDHLEVGDSFYLHVLGQTLEYWVDNIAVVDPYDYSLLTIEEGKDMVTLVTCTPYGINSHRLLVRGSRVVYAPNTSVTLQVDNEVSGVDVMLVVPAALVCVVLIVFVFLLIDRKKQRKIGGKAGGEIEES